MESISTVNVVQGEYKYSSDPNTVLTTVLGSCVACCLYDDVAQIGGMNHFLLASGGENDTSQLKYGLNAMEVLINQILKGGGQRKDLKAKLFGGAAITDAFAKIGKSNGAFALEFLENEKIPCVSHSLGGSSARRIRFFPTSGLAQQKVVQPEQVKEVIAPMPAAAPQKSIELF